MIPMAKPGADRELRARRPRPDSRGLDPHAPGSRPEAADRPGLSPSGDGVAAWASRRPEFPIRPPDPSVEWHLIAPTFQANPP